MKQAPQISHLTGKLSDLDEVVSAEHRSGCQAHQVVSEIYHSKVIRLLDYKHASAPSSRSDPPSPSSGNLTIPYFQRIM
eukprot:192851-Hanusia_phi.AAC.1